MNRYFFSYIVSTSLSNRLTGSSYFNAESLTETAIDVATAKLTCDLCTDAAGLGKVESVVITSIVKLDAMNGAQDAQTDTIAKRLVCAAKLLAAVKAVHSNAMAGIFVGNDYMRVSMAEVDTIVDAVKAMEACE